MKSHSFLLTKALLVAGRAFVAPKIRSRTLRRALNSYMVQNKVGYLNVPHFWAWYYHDGRGPLKYKPKGSKPAVYLWFTDPRDDPRYFGNYPINRRQQKRHRLTKEEIRSKKKSGDIVVTRGPVKRSKANPFFSNTGGMRGFVSKANTVVKRNIDILIAEDMKKRGIYKTKITRYI